MSLNHKDIPLPSDIHGLAIHDPAISWKQGELKQWSKTCYDFCIHATVSMPCLTTSIESPGCQVAIKIPEEYHEFLDVFSKRKAAQLPPHCSWDCAIDLLSNMGPSRSKAYLLSRPETMAMETYVKASLASGYIRTSTSPDFFCGEGWRPSSMHR